MDKRTIGWLLSEFGAKLVIGGVAVYTAIAAARYVHAAFVAMTSMPL